MQSRSRQDIDTSSQDPFLSLHPHVRLTARYFRIALVHFGATPALRAEILKGTRVSEEELDDPNLLITLDQQYRQYRNLVGIFGEGYAVASPEPWGHAAHGQTILANQSAPNLLIALETLQTYGVDVDEVFEYSISHDGPKSYFQYSAKIELDEGYERASLEIGYIGLRSLFYIYLHRPPTEAEYYFRCRMPNHHELARSALGGAVTYEAPYNAIAFPSEWLRSESPLRNDQLYRAVRAQLDVARSGGDEPTRQRVETLLRTHPRGRASLSEVAAELGLSPRSLVRHLSAGGTSFRELSETEQARRVDALLGGGLKLSDVAERLRYSDATSLARARRRWARRRQT